MGIPRRKRKGLRNEMAMHEKEMFDMIEASKKIDPIQELISTLSELVDLVDSHLDGEYEMDSLTTQPARRLLEKLEDGKLQRNF